ncbi:MAG: sensor histidine kinase [Bacillota bacterium]|nr:sensor histidine kinase [Bacillota bacterium]
MRSLKYELTLYITLVIVIILTAVGSISYRSNKRAVELRVSESTVENMKQIDKNFDYILGDIKDISLFVVSNNNIRNYTKLQKDETDKISDTLLKLNEEFANLTNSKTYISAINVYGENGLNFETAGPSINLGGVNMSDYEKMLPKDGSFVITPTYKRYYPPMGSQYVISFYRQINDINNFARKLGILRIDLNENEISKIYKDIKLGSTGHIFVANKDGYVVSHSDKSEISHYIKDEPYFENAFASNEGYYREKINGVDTLITYYTSRELNLVIIGMVPFKELINEAEVARRLNLLLIIIGSVIALILSYIISLKITQPIKKLTVLMKMVEEGELDVVFDIKRKDEIAALGRSFNSMTAELRTLIEDVYKNQISRKEAELRALQSQINPHFLYNTLDVIYWTSRMEKAPKTGEIINALAKLFRLGLNRGSEITTVKKELEHLENYLIIQKMRYDEVPQIEIDVDRSLDEYSTIKVILQPLVENALIHGIADLEGEGRVRITGRAEGKEIVLVVSDNGVGMDEETIKEIFQGDFQAKKGFGLKNVNERIKLYFGEKYGIKIDSQKGKGTRVEIRIPKVSEKIGGEEAD